MSSDTPADCERAAEERERERAHDDGTALRLGDSGRGSDCEPDFADEGSAFRSARRAVRRFYFRFRRRALRMGGGSNPNMGPNLFPFRETKKNPKGPFLSDPKRSLRGER